MTDLQLGCAVSAGTFRGWLYVEAWLEAAPPKLSWVPYWSMTVRCTQAVMMFRQHELLGGCSWSPSWSSYIALMYV